MKEKYLIFRIKSLSNEMKRLLDRSNIAGNTENLTGMQYAMLGFINKKQKYGEVFQKDIEAEFNIRRSTASGMMAFLEKNEYIIREPVPGDARLKRISLTEKARKVDSFAKANLKAVETRLIQGIDSDELEQFYTTLNKIFDNAK